MDERPSTGPARPALPWLVILFVGSGAAALIYEIVWFQLLELVLGSSAMSVGVLLGTFMGGMCLGSLLLPRVMKADWHPLRVYAGLEVGVGVMGLVLLFAMPLVGGAYTAWTGGGIIGILLRGVAAAICLLPPTLLMGATLPAIARWVQTTPEGVEWLGFFYGGNIAGAVVGSLLAGFYLLRAYDVTVATFVAVVLNLTVCGLGLAIAEATRYDAVEARTAKAERAPDAWSIYATISACWAYWLPRHMITRLAPSDPTIAPTVFAAYTPATSHAGSCPGTATEASASGKLAPHRIAPGRTTHSERTRSS